MLKRLLYIVALMTISHTVAIAQQGLNYWFDTPTTLEGRATWLLFLMEENALQNHYDIVFNKLTLSEITNHTYQ
jgi:hypothetical protein